MKLKSIVFEELNKEYYFEVTTNFELRNAKNSEGQTYPTYFVVDAISERKAEEKLEDFMGSTYGMTENHDYKYNKISWSPKGKVEYKQL